MAMFKVAVIRGHRRQQSPRIRQSQAHQDLEADLPKSVARFKSQIAAAEGLLFVTPEHNRSIPSRMKNAIDRGARP
jgi:NAD(P)H-dependent FMN reductase